MQRSINLLNQYKLFNLMKMSRQPENAGGVVCHYNADYFIIQQRFQAKFNPNNQYMQINRKNQQITMIPKKSQAYQSRKFSAFIGIIDFDGQKFLLFCDEATIVSAIDTLQIFQISSLFFVGYTDQKVLKKKPQRKEIYRKIRQYYIILKSGFYFSYKYNLTVPLKSQSNQQMAQRFTWNFRFFAQFQKYKVPFKWKCPIIQGFVKSFEVFLQGTKLGYVLISRRSNKKGGTRYFDRGLNQEGFVANFCQTQQIIKLDQFIISDVQIRGSIPLFFEQVGLTTSTKINRGYQLTHQVYKKHIQKLTKQYKRVFFVNLLSVGKRGQKMLTEQLQAHIKSEVNTSLKYLYYDFHKKVAGGYYQKVDQIINQIRPMKLNLRYYVFNSKTNTVLEEPFGIFRTNCLDCLDRTNFFQAKLALITLQTILKQFNICNRNLLDQMKDNNQDNDFIKNFRHIWADNGDAISWHYTGTGSTHTDITRDGKRGWLGNFKHKYKTITRFYNQNFWDFYKMKLVGLLLGQKRENEGQSVTKIMKDRQNEYVKRQMCEVYIFTWKAPKKAAKYLPLFPNTPKIIAINIQDLSQEQKWNKVILDSIDKQRYILVEQKKAYGNMLKIFAHKQLKNEITFVQHGKIKFNTYYNAVLSNKCANFIRFNLRNTKLVFIGCQLQKGREFIQNRIRNIKEIHEMAFQVEQVGLQKSSSILSDDVIFLFGNMNTNISSSFKTQLSKFNDLGKLGEEQKKLIGQMMETDEFEQIRQNLLECREYQEEDITFPPTYKYTNNSFDLEQSGWPDRIWYSSQNKIACTKYSVIQELRNQHVPVIGSFSVEIEKVNNELKQKICNEIIERQGESLGLFEQDSLQQEEVQQMQVKL